LVRRYVKVHHVSYAALVASGIAAALVFFIIGAGIRLLIGPVSLGPFSGTLASALDRALPGITVKYDQAAIEWARDEGRVNLVILGTRVFDHDGRIIAQAPKADIDLAARPFLQGRIVVKRIALVGVQLTLVRTADGELRLGVEQDKQEHDILSRLSDAIRANNGSTASLESFAVRNARLALYDEATGLFIVAPQADFRLFTAGARLAAHVDAAVEISGQPAHVAADFFLPPKQGKIQGEVSLTGLEVPALAANSTMFAAVRDTALRVDLAGSFTAENAHLLSARFNLSARGAFLIPDIKDGRVKVASLRAVGRYDAASRQLLIESAAINSDKIKARLQGLVDLKTDSAGQLVRLGFNLRANNLALAMSTVFARPVEFQLVDVRAAWMPTSRELQIDHLGISGLPLSMDASGKLTLVRGQTPSVDVKGTIAPIGVRDLVHYWPRMAVSGGREWTDANMSAGTVGPTSFEIHLPAGLLDHSGLPANSLNVKFAVDGGQINYVKGLTQLTQVKGIAIVTGDTFRADVSSAKIGPLTVSSAHFVIPDLNVPDETGEVTGHVQGAVPDVLALVDLPPLRYPTRFGVKPADSKGNAELDLSFRVPLRKALAVDQVNIGIKAAVTGFALALGPHTQLTDGTVSFSIDNDKLHATGMTGISGSASRVNLDWVELFRSTNNITTKVAVKGVLDEQARAALNIHGNDYLKGPIGITGTLLGHRGALSQANLNLDLTPANVTFGLIGLNKPAGFPMTARVNAAFGENSTLASESFRVTGPATSVIANARFDSNERLIQLQAPTVRIGPLNDFSLNLARNDSGTDIAIRGHSIDGTHLANHDNGESSDTVAEPYHLNAKLDRVVLRDGVVLAPFALDITGVDDRAATMSLSASLSKTATVTASMIPTDTGRRMTFSTNDTGLFTRGLFGFNSMRGGKIDLNATFPGPADKAVNDPNTPDFQGRAVLSDFRVVDQPFLARVFSAGSLGGLVNLMKGQGIAVDSLEIPFTSRGGVISVRDARATGPAIGITADGYIDRPKNDIALKGSLVPLYGLNSVFGNIPLLGNVLTSKQGEGIFGMSYSVSGNADEPSVSVNPLSVLAPGILRRIFEGRLPTAPRVAPDARKPGTPPQATVPAPTPPGSPQPAPKGT
jgi:Protein of unknown function/AsmA-like C-terminal region